MNSAKYWINKLQLQQHHEGGWFKEVYRSENIIPQSALSGTISGDRNYCTSIYYLLNKNDFIAFHRIKSDEIWHFHTGNSEIQQFTKD